ncbi:hypothetical protein DB30_02520 [Enhygromyxa salina]|uniref:LysM domain-containing protein n=1 Tax=Enhygromyxa salina TaxID=215803 RepID=A0A0C2DE22_9BACT|nr:hypothetical protein [Enhygromyxa salina]KIG17897.1 hypothetical protein DB30_02520 [Enhygromyxa salina]
MSLYAKNSRYVRHASIVEVTDEQGRKVKRVGRAKQPPLAELGEHIRREGQRLDHLANYYLRDPSAYWKICELNDVLLPDQLAEVELIKIPTPY